MFSTPDFWVFIAFILFLCLFGKRGFVFLTQYLDQHRQKIAHQLEEAQRLHDEALSLLNSYKEKHEGALVQAKQIMASAERDALVLKNSREQDLEKLLAHKEKVLLERIAIETEEMKSKLKEQAIEEALALVEERLSKNLKEKKKLTKASLKEISALDLSV